MGSSLPSAANAAVRLLALSVTGIAALAIGLAWQQPAARSGRAPMSPQADALQVRPVDGSAPEDWSTPAVVSVDLTPWTGQPRVDLVAYDLDAALRPVSVRGLRTSPAWQIAVRLILSEVGAGRLVRNRWGTAEAVGVLQTVVNRMDPSRWNPERIPRLGGFEGCGPADTLGVPFEEAFVSCVHPEQYLGLHRARGLRPRDYGDPAVLREAVDRAVRAWWLVAQHRVPDLTAGATMYVHRCGGAAYGAPTTRCDRDEAVPDLPGANSHRGPIAFKAPHHFLPGRGLYTMRLSSVLDYTPGPEPVAPSAIPTYAWARSLHPTRRDPALAADLARLDALHRPEGAAP